MNKIEIYKDKGKNVEVEVRFEDDSVWLNQNQMSALFNQSKQNISLHIANIYKEKELSGTSTVKESLTVQKEGKVKVNIKECL